MYQCPCHIWYLGIWYLDILVSWNLDILVSWYLGTCTCSHKWALGKHWSDCHLEISCRLLVLKTCLRTKTDLEYHCRQLWMKPSGIRTVEFHSTHLSYVMISRTHLGPIIPDLCLPWWAIQNSMPAIIVNRINPAWPVERVERVLSDPFQTWRWWSFSPLCTCVRCTNSFFPVSQIWPSPKLCFVIVQSRLRRQLPVKILNQTWQLDGKGTKKGGQDDNHSVGRSCFASKTENTLMTFKCIFI